MDRIAPYIDHNIIKVLVGQRRVGKSYILRAVADEITHRNPDANLVTINLEDFAFSNITDAKSLHEAISSQLSEGKKNYGRVVELLIAASYNREKGEFEDWGREVSVALP